MKNYDQGIKFRKQLVSVLILLLLIFFTFFYYLRGYSLQELQNALVNAKTRYLVIGFGMMLIFILCEAMNIKLILRTLGHITPLIRCFRYSSIGFYFSSITPSSSGGQPAQVYYMKREGIPVATSSITFFFIVFVYQISMILVGTIMSLLRFSVAIKFIQKLNYLFIYGIIINTSVIFILFSLMFSKKLVPLITLFLLKAGTKLGVVKNAAQTKAKFDNFLSSYHEKAYILRKHTRLFFKILAITVVQITALNSIPSLVYYSLGYDVKNIMDIFTSQSLLTISVSAIPLPGAEGVTQTGFMQVYASYFPQNMLAYSMLISRALSFYLPLLLSFIIYIYTHLKTAKQSGRGDYIEGK